MYTIILSQDKFVHKDALLFPIEERGLQFGDGVYEVIRIYAGEAYLLDEHIARLFRSLQAISLSIPYTKADLKKDLQALIEKNDMREDGFIYLQITRGSAERNHTFPRATGPNIYAYIKARERLTSFMEDGVKAITYPDERWDNCYIKSLNLLPNVLAKQKAEEKDAFEAILHRDDIVTEASAANVFIVKQGILYTHPEAKTILSGCTRASVIRFAHEKSLPLKEEAFTVEQLLEADEVFITSSLSEIIPVIQINDLRVNSGKPGPITRSLQAAYEVDAGLR
ncbi:MAG TPA: D-amino-acid transaminase [Pseudogracilibacillus sp.]|nr:D-amino-acid transaminase [Pseudogracilibacillus sp.]